MVHIDAVRILSVQNGNFGLQNRIFDLILVWWLITDYSQKKTIFTFAYSRVEWVLRNGPATNRMRHWTGTLARPRQGNLYLESKDTPPRWGRIARIHLSDWGFEYLRIEYLTRSCSTYKTKQLSVQPHGGVRGSHRKSTCIAQSTLGRYVVQIWSRYGQDFNPTKPSNSTEWYDIHTINTQAVWQRYSQN